MRLMKHFSILAAVLVGVVTCVAAEPPALDKAQATQIGMDFTREKKWEVINVWGGTLFNERTREWRMFINTKQNGGPMIVYINDETKKVRFGLGE